MSMRNRNDLCTLVQHTAWMYEQQMPKPFRKFIYDNGPFRKAKELEV